MLFNSYLQYLHISGYKPKRVLCGYRIYIVKTIEFFFSLSVKNFASRLTRKMDFVDWFDFDPLSERQTIVDNMNWDEIPVENIEPIPHDDINVDQFTFSHGVEETKENDFYEEATEDMSDSNKLKTFFIVKVSQITLRMLRVSLRKTVRTKSNLEDIIQEKESFLLRTQLLFQWNETSLINLPLQHQLHIQR